MVFLFADQFVRPAQPSLVNKQSLSWSRIADSTKRLRVHEMDRLCMRSIFGDGYSPSAGCVMDDPTGLENFANAIGRLPRSSVSTFGRFRTVVRHSSLRGVSLVSLCWKITLMGIVSAGTVSASTGRDEFGPKRLPPVRASEAEEGKTGSPAASESSTWRVPESIWGSRLIQWSDACAEVSGDANSVSGPRQFTATDAQAQLRKQTLAKAVSQQILDHPTGLLRAELPVARSVSVTSRQQLDWASTATSKSELLVERGAFYGARQHAREALMHFATAADMQPSTSGLERENERACDLVRQAFQAIREAGDFVGRFGSVDQSGCERMVMSHETTVLKSNPGGISGHAAAGVYLDHARQNLSRALVGYPDARQALAILGKCEAQCDENPEGIRLGIQLCCFRAAVALAPSDAELLKQFGVLCINSGLVSEGQWALEQAVYASRDSKAALALMELYSRTGNHPAAVKLQGHMATLQESGETPEKTIYLVTPEQFASISPPVQSGRTQGDLSSMFAGRKDTARVVGSQVIGKNDEKANLQTQGNASIKRLPGGPYGSGAQTSVMPETPRSEARTARAEADADQRRAEGIWGRFTGQLRTVFQ